MLERIRQGMIPFLFTFALLSFLVTSIPKVAWMFDQYSTQRSIEWSIASYGTAITIDLLAAFLIYALTAKKINKGVSRWVWLSILCLVAYSFALNLFYNQLHAPGVRDMQTIWIYDIFPGWNMEQITNIMISLAPVWIIGFAMIARLIREERTDDLEALELQAAQADRKATARERISMANAKLNKTRLVNTLDLAKVALSSLRKERSSESERQVKQSQNSGQKAVSDATKTEVKPTQTGEQNDVQGTMIDDLEMILPGYPNMAQLVSTGQKTATIDEIVEATGYHKRRISNRVADGILKRSPRNAELIIISSVVEWLKTAHMTEQNSGNLKAIKLSTVAPMNSTNGHHREEV